MPIPEPSLNEKQSDFIARCMGSDVMDREYPDTKQRSAVCYSSWRKEHPDPLEGSHSFLLSTGPALPISAAKTKSGVPSQFFRKEIIRDGHYVKVEDGIKFEVTPELRAHWVTTFSRMKRNGVPVPIPAGHTDDAENNHGFVRSIFAEGESLFATIELIGKDAVDLAARNHVSIFVPPEFPDGKGNIYKRPIRHIALTPTPVIPGLGDWESVAASLTLKGNTMEWKEVQEGLGIKDEMTDGTAGKLLLAHFKGLKEEQEKLQLAFDELKKAGKGGDDDKKPPAAKPDPMLLSLSTENRLMKLNALVEAARITPAVRDKLKEQYATEKSLTLALSHGGDNFDALVAALAENNPVELAEKSGPQTMALSMGMADGKNPVVEDAKRRAEVAAKSA